MCHASVAAKQLVVRVNALPSNRCQQTDWARELAAAAELNLLQAAAAASLFCAIWTAQLIGACCDLAKCFQLFVHIFLSVDPSSVTFLHPA